MGVVYMFSFLYRILLNYKRNCSVATSSVCLQTWPISACPSRVDPQPGGILRPLPHSQRLCAGKSSLARKWRRETSWNGNTPPTRGEMKDAWMLLPEVGPCYHGDGGALTLSGWAAAPMDFNSSWSVPPPSVNCCPQVAAWPRLSWSLLTNGCLYSQATNCTLINERANYSSLLPAHLSN